MIVGIDRARRRCAKAALGHKAGVPFQCIYIFDNIIQALSSIPLRASLGEPGGALHNGNPCSPCRLSALCEGLVN
jgi:hypothetical protein